MALTAEPGRKRITLAPRDVAATVAAVRPTRRELELQQQRQGHALGVTRSEGPAVAVCVTPASDSSLGVKGAAAALDASAATLVTSSLGSPGSDLVTSYAGSVSSPLLAAVDRSVLSH